jgi:glucose dehydrogenase
MIIIGVFRQKYLALFICAILFTLSGCGSPWQYPITDPSGDFSCFIVSPDILYVCPTASSLVALNAQTGTLIWHRELKQNPVYGAVLANGILYLNERGGISAYKATDGTERWHTSLTDNSVGDNTITPVVANDSVYTIASNHLSDTVYALSAVNGHILWHRSLQSPGFYGKQPLAVAGNTVLLTDVYHSPYSPTPNPMSQQGASLTALRANDGGMLWKNWFGGFSDPSLSIDHDVVYAVSLSSDTATNILHAWQIKTGRQLWSVPVS